MRKLPIIIAAALFTTAASAAPFGQAPATQQEFDAMKEEQKQERESDNFYQQQFNRDIAQQGGRPSPDKTYRKRPILGRYDANGNFIKSRVQPSHQLTVPGVPMPTSFPAYERQLQDSFKF